MICEQDSGSDVTWKEMYTQISRDAGMQRIELPWCSERKGSKISGFKDGSRMFCFTRLCPLSARLGEYSLEGSRERKDARAQSAREHFKTRHKSPGQGLAFRKWNSKRLGFSVRIGFPQLDTQIRDNKSHSRLPRQRGSHAQSCVVHHSLPPLALR